MRRISQSIVIILALAAAVPVRASLPIVGNITTTCPGNTIAMGGTLAVTGPGACPGCVGGTYTFPSGAGGPIDVLRVLYVGQHHDGTFDCNSAVRRSLVAKWPALFQMSCLGEGTCLPTGLTHAWVEPVGSPVTKAFSSLVGLGGEFCNTTDANGLPPDPNVATDYQDHDPIRIVCDTDPVTGDDVDTVCEMDGTLGVVLPIRLPDTPGIVSTDVYPTHFCDPSNTCGLSKTGNPLLPCPRNGPKLLGRCFQPAFTRPDGTKDFQCIAQSFNKCFGDQGVDGRAYNLPVKKPTTGPIVEPAQYVFDSDADSMVGSFFRIHMLRPSSYAPAGAPVCQQFTNDAQIGCLVSSDPCTLGDAGPAAIGVSANQALY
jgi:hypothetical protein